MLRIALGFAGGITGYAVLPLPAGVVFWIVAALTLTLLFMGYVIFSTSNHHISYVTGLVTMLAFILSGMLAAHIDRLRGAVRLPTVASHYLVQVESTPRHTDSHSVYVVRTVAIYHDSAWRAGGGKGMLYIKDDSTGTAGPGTRVLIQGNAGVLHPPLNPGAFDYRAYLHRRGIYYRDFVEKNGVYLLPYDHATPSVLLLRANQYLREQINRMTDDPENQAVISAMLLGDKKDLPDELRTAYSAAGASHILAVSGLHVGIIYLVLHTLLAGLRRRATTRGVFYILALAAIWMFAAITAFSPSVTRAAIMISFVLIGQATRSGTRMINSLSAAAFLMLLYDPDVLFDVGFQLSFGAVAGIALFHAGIYHSVRLRNRLADYIWKIIALSIAVQLAIAPLVAFYFHQFPLLFPVTNIVVIPATALILVCTVVLLPLWSVFGSISWTDTVYDALVGTLNGFVRTIESVPFSHLDRIYLNLAETVLLTCLLVCAGRFILYRSRQLVAPLALSGLLLFASIVQGKISINRREAMLVYSHPRTVLIDFMRGKNWTGYSADTLVVETTQKYILQPARLQYGMKPRNRIPLRAADVLRGPGWDCLVFAGKKVLVITGGERLALAPLPPAPDLVILGDHIADRGLAHVLATGPGHMLMYSARTTDAQQRMISEKMGHAGWTDLSRGSFSLPH